MCGIRSHGCGHFFTFYHGLDCRAGGLVTQRHNEIRDALGDTASKVHKEIYPMGACFERVCTHSRLIGVHGEWQPQTIYGID